MRRAISAALVALLCLPAAAVGGWGEVAECIVVPRQGAIQTQCDHEPGYDGGCSQRLARADWEAVRTNWYSTGYPNGEPMLGQQLWCDVPTQRAFRGVYKINYSANGSTWVVAKMIVEPGDAVAELDATAEHTSYYWDEWHCNRTDPENGAVLESYKGSYARELAVLGVFPTSGELVAVASFDFELQPDYWDAYDAVAAGYIAVRGYAENPFPGDSPAGQEEAWQKRMAVFDLVARGEAAAGHAAVEPWWTMVLVSEYVIQRYMREGPMPTGWPTYENDALTAAIDRIYQGTAAEYDPDRLYQDSDVAMDPSSWGAAKWLYRALPRRELTHD